MHSDLKNIIATKGTLSHIFNFNISETKITSRSYEELDTLLLDNHVHSCIQSRKAGVLSLEWEITESPHTAFIKPLFDNIDIRQVISEMLDAVLYGFKPIEIYWDLFDGYLIPYNLVGKPAKWFDFDKNNLLRYNDTNGIQYVPKKKFILVRHGATYENPYGETILAKVYDAVRFKTGSVKLWSYFAKKYGIPFLVGKTMSNDAKDSQDLLDALDLLAQGGLAVFPEHVNIEVHNAAPGTAEVFERFISFCNAEISKTILSQTLTTEQGDSGSYAMSKTHFDVRKEVVEADQYLVKSAFDTLIKWIVELNFGETKDLPRFIMFEKTDVDKNLAERDKILVDTGIKFSKEYYKTAYGFKDNDFEIVDLQPQAQPQPQFSESQDIDKATEIALDDFESAMDKFVKPVLKMIEKGDSYEEIQKALPNFFPELDTNDIETIIARAILISSAAANIDNLKSKTK